MFGIEDMREPKFCDHSKCDECGAVFDNDDLNELPDDVWLCDDCLDARRIDEMRAWETIKQQIIVMEREIESVNNKYKSITDKELNNLWNLLEQAWAIINKTS